jgi:type IV secretion system protein VirD4
MAHINASVDHIERPLITPDEVLRLKPPQKRGDGAQERIVAPGQMLVFVSGHHPILGTQMLYFLDPALNSRAELAPPTGFITLEDGKPVPQHTLNRTRNIVSKPELVSPPECLPNDEPFSGIEHHLVEELHVEQGEQ